MNYAPAFTAPDDDRVIRRWRIFAPSPELAIAKAHDQAAQAGWRLVQVTDCKSGETYYRRDA